MFDHPLFLPVALIVIVLGLFYLIVSSRNAASRSENAVEREARDWQGQCPNCQRWDQMRPIQLEELPDGSEAPLIDVLPGTPHFFLHTYKCKYCGHSWQERYSA